MTVADERRSIRTLAANVFSKHIKLSERAKFYYTTLNSVRHLLNCKRLIYAAKKIKTTQIIALNMHYDRSEYKVAN